ncbi:MAG: hypothetical protein M1821_004854 [Bathelium mastoideum]|nr:MAG: hypothetical protein M1821_004854 [Bathelium mastoideum]
MLTTIFLILLRFTLLAAAYTKLSDSTLRSLPEAGSDFDVKIGAILSPILVPRVSGTPNSTLVLKHFVDFFQTNLPDWRLEFQNSTQTPPAPYDEPTPFVNLIATRDPPWASVGDVSRLALVAHYDSKVTPEGFIGAVDSAAPCAMLLHTARSIDAALTKKWGDMKAQGLGEGGLLEEERGVQIILLDGEEAFVSWTDTDSTYGARSLAESWENAVHPATSNFPNAISSISLFVLLDLLGSANPIVPSYYKTTHWAYQSMARLEDRLRSLQQFKSSPNHPSKRSATHRDPSPQDQSRAEPMFLNEADKKTDRWFGGRIGDDHVPFMQRGVEVLHIIPNPFPRVWHREDDDGEHLDMDTVEDWTKLVTAFAAEWMELEGFLDTSAGRKRDLRYEGEQRTSVISKTEL